jgi:hypothetical protein
MKYLLLVLLSACGESDSGSVSFPCGATTCDSATQYCYSLTGGVMLETGDTGDAPVCTAYPTACADDPSCACLDAEGLTTGGDCTEEEGGVFLHVNAP